MEKALITISVLLTILVSTPSFGTPIIFSTDYTGTEGYSAPVSAYLDYTVSGNIVNIILDNTSGLFDSEGNTNSPAIVALGFNTSGESESGNLLVQAYSFISGSGSGDLIDISARWELSVDDKLQGTGGLRFDFITNTTNGVQYGLINPDAIGADGSNLFETIAYLTIEFDSLPGDLSDWYVRFQNVGADGEYSITASGAPVPEPATMLLLGAGIIGLVGLRKKFFG